MLASDGFLLLGTCVLGGGGTRWNLSWLRTGAVSPFAFVRNRRGRWSPTFHRSNPAGAGSLWNPWPGAQRTWESCFASNATARVSGPPLYRRCRGWWAAAVTIDSGIPGEFLRRSMAEPKTSGPCIPAGSGGSGNGALWSSTESSGAGTTPSNLGGDPLPLLSRRARIDKRRPAFADDAFIQSGSCANHSQSVHFWPLACRRAPAGGKHGNSNGDVETAVRSEPPERISGLPPEGLVGQPAA